MENAAARERVFRRGQAVKLGAEGMCWRNVAKKLNLPHVHGI